MIAQLSPLCVDKCQNYGIIILTIQRVRVLINRGIMMQVDSIVCGDCLDVMRNIPDGSIDLVVTSPPYNIGKEYETPLSLDDYISWSRLWIYELYRVVSPTGTFWLNLGYIRVDGRAKALPISYLLWREIPFYLIQEVVWNYGAGVAGRKFLSPRNEKFLWYVKDKNNYTFNLDDIRDPNVKYPNQKKNGKLKCNPLGKNPTDVWRFPKVTSGKNRSSPERTGHPAQYPEALITRVVKASSNKGDLVFDPFIGSGTTAVVASRLKRRFYGCDTSQEYVDMALKRLAEHYGQYP